MDYFDENSMGDLDFTDQAVEYVPNDQDEITYETDPMVTSGVDQDYPHVVPEDNVIPFDAIQNPEIQQEMYDINNQPVDEYAPTKTVGVAQDFVDLSKAITQGDEKMTAMALSTFSDKQLARFTSPKVVGPLLLMYAYRGKFSAVERLIIGLIGAGAVVSGYKLLKQTQSGEVQVHPLLSKANQMASAYNNPLAGRY